MPLANRRDKITEITWGIKDFVYRFGRMPEGMWLSETAVDNETLDLLAMQGIKFTILAPHQARRVRRTGEENWTDVRKETLDTSRPYRCTLPSGRTIAIFFYEPSIAFEVAFGNLLENVIGLRTADKGFSKRQERATTGLCCNRRRDLRASSPVCRYGTCLCPS